MQETNTAEGAPPFFAVGRTKMLLLSLATLNLYQIVWFFQHWQYRRRVMGEDLRPVARCIFVWAYALPLGALIGKRGAKEGLFPKWLALSAAALWLGCVIIAGFLPDGPLVLLGLLTIAPAIWLQTLANRVNRAVAPNHHPNSRLTLANKITLGLGAIVVPLAAAALFLDEDPGVTVTIDEDFRLPAASQVGERAVEQGDGADERRER